MECGFRPNGLITKNRGTYGNRLESYAGRYLCDDKNLNNKDTILENIHGHRSDWKIILHIRVIFAYYYNSYFTVILKFYTTKGLFYNNALNSIQSLNL